MTNEIYIDDIMNMITPLEGSKVSNETIAYCTNTALLSDIQVFISHEIVIVGVTI